MGASASMAKIDNTVSATISVLNDTNQSCTNDNISNMIIAVRQKGCNSQNIKIDGIKFGSAGEWDVNCTQTNMSNVEIKQDVINELKNTAESIVGSLGVGASVAKAITENSVVVAQNITNAYGQECANKVARTKGIYLDQDGGGTDCDRQDIEITNIFFSDMDKAMSSCVQENDNVVKSVQALKNTVSNAASSKVEGILGPLLMLVLLIMIPVAAGMMGGTKILTSPAFMGTLVALVLIYGGVAWIKEWFPFLKSDDPDN